MPTIKGTASVIDDHAMAKLLRKTKFPKCFKIPVDRTMVHIAVLTQWIEDRVTAILGFEDDIVQSTAINLFLPEANSTSSGIGAADGVDVEPVVVDPRRAQLDLAGFLGETEAAQFAKELWELLLDAQTTPTGIPRKLLERKKEELAQKMAAQNAASNAAVRAIGFSQASVAAEGGESDVNRMIIEARHRAEGVRLALIQRAPPPLGPSGGPAIQNAVPHLLPQHPVPITISPTLPAKAEDEVSPPAAVDIHHNNQKNDIERSRQRSPPTRKQSGNEDKFRSSKGQHAAIPPSSYRDRRHRERSANNDSSMIVDKRAGRARSRSRSRSASKVDDEIPSSHHRQHTKKNSRDLSNNSRSGADSSESDQRRRKHERSRDGKSSSRKRESPKNDKNNDRERRRRRERSTSSSRSTCSDRDRASSARSNFRRKGDTKRSRARTGTGRSSKSGRSRYRHEPSGRDRSTSSSYNS